jgi:hypothetical protein
VIHTAAGVTVRWVGGLWVRWGADALLIDAGPATVGLGPELAALRALLLTSGRMRAIGGLPALLEAAAPWREAELPVHHLLGEERSSFLVEAWQRGWPDRYPVSLDARPPGDRFDLGPFAVTTRRVVRGEPVVAARLQGPLTIAWVPLSDADAQIVNVCRGADLAVIQVATRGPGLGASEAISAAEGVGLLWLIDEAGAPVDAPAA